LNLAKNYSAVPQDPPTIEISNPQTPNCDMVFLDIGGNRELESVALILKFLQAELSPRMIVVKSSELFHHAQNFYRSLENAEASMTFLETGPWWTSLENLIAESNQKLTGLYPLKYPNKTSNGILICRYHNYSECKKGNECPFDHDHCNTCGVQGHVSKNCPKFNNI